MSSFWKAYDFLNVDETSLHRLYNLIRTWRTGFWT